MTFTRQLVGNRILNNVPGMRITHPRSAAAGVAWYLSGSISAANCLAAWQPIGADDLADSYINLANPGTYDAAPGNAPDWDGTNGWKFVAGNSDELFTGINQAETMSVIIRFSNRTSAGIIFGSRGDPRYYLDLGAAHVQYHYGTWYVASGSGAATAGVLCIAAGSMYRDGAADGSRSYGGTPGSTYPMAIGALARSAGTADTNISAYVQAMAVYDIGLSSDQVSAVTTAMNAL